MGFLEVPGSPVRPCLGRGGGGGPGHWSGPPLRQEGGRPVGGGAGVGRTRGAPVLPPTKVAPETTVYRPGGGPGWVWIRGPAHQGMRDGKGHFMPKVTLSDGGRSSGACDECVRVRTCVCETAPCRQNCLCNKFSQVPCT